MEKKTIKLPYADNALEPVMGRDTIETHFGKHYINYVNNYNNLVSQHAEFADSSISDVILHSDGPLFNNAAQVVNHELFFLQFAMRPMKDNHPKGVLLDAINNHFGNFEELRKLLTQRATALFGSGWVWLALDGTNLVIANGSNAYTPITQNMRPLLAIDVWEHAYYLDYKEKRVQYLDGFWSIIDWNIIEHRYINALEHNMSWEE